MKRQPIEPEDILLRLDWTEDDDLEFKSGKGGVPGSLWETYSAIANTHGGVILLGVEDDGTVSGVEKPERVKKSLWDSLNNRNKVNTNLLTEGDVAEVAHPDGTIVAIRVPRASRGQRPVFIGQNPLTGTYRRNYEGDYHCSEKEVARMLSDGSESPFDSQILEHFTIDDLDSVSLIPEESLERLQALFGPSFSQFDQNEVQVLVTADIESEVDNYRIRQICNIHAADVTLLLQGLVAKDALVRDGHGRWSRYRLPYAVDSEHTGEKSLHNDSKSTHKAGHSLHKTDDSLHNELDSLHKTDDSLHNEELLVIAEPARTQQRLNPAEMESILLALCKGRWMTRHELSLLVERNSESLRQRFLNPMVAHGLLQLRYPDKRNRVDQAYTATRLVKENAVSLTKPEPK